MCHKLCHFIWSKDFEAMKAVKLPIRPWLSCPYNEHRLVLLPSSVAQPRSHFTVSKPAWQCNYRANREGLACQKAVKTMSVQVTYQEKNGFKNICHSRSLHIRCCYPDRALGNHHQSSQERMQATKNRYKFHNWIK